MFLLVLNVTNCLKKDGSSLWEPGHHAGHGAPGRDKTSAYMLRVAEQKVERACVSEHLAEQVSHHQELPISQLVTGEKYHRAGGINKRNLFSHSSGGETPEIRVWGGLLSSPEALLPGCLCPASLRGLPCVSAS